MASNVNAFCSQDYELRLQYGGWFSPCSQHASRSVCSQLGITFVTFRVLSIWMLEVNKWQCAYTICNSSYSTSQYPIINITEPYKFVKFNHRREPSVHSPQRLQEILVPLVLSYEPKASIHSPSWSSSQSSHSTSFSGTPQLRSQLLPCGLVAGSVLHCRR